MHLAHQARPGAAPDASRSQHHIPTDQGQLYLACVVLFPVLFLSVSASKLGTYALPLYPAVALLVADQFWRLQQAMPGWLRRGLLVQGVFTLLASLLYIGVLARPDDLKQVDWNYLPLLAVAIGIFLIGGLWSGIVAWRGKLLRALAINGLALFLTIALVLPNAFHVLKYIDARALTVPILSHGHREDAILVTNDCVQDYSILWQLDRPLNVLGDPRELGMGMYTQATAHDAPWPIDVHTRRPTMDLTELRRDQVPGQIRLWTPAQTAQAWSGSRRIWLFGAGPWILPLLAAGKTVYEVGRTDKVTLVTNLPIPGVTTAPMTHYTHGLP
jgi:hypothetical protein